MHSLLVFVCFKANFIIHSLIDQVTSTLLLTCLLTPTTTTQTLADSISISLLAALLIEQKQEQNLLDKAAKVNQPIRRVSQGRVCRRRRRRPTPSIDTSIHHDWCPIVPFLLFVEHHHHIHQHIKHWPIRAHWSMQKRRRRRILVGHFASTKVSVLSGDGWTHLKTNHHHHHHHCIGNNVSMCFPDYGLLCGQVKLTQAKLTQKYQQKNGRWSLN